jgi:hypothetical protein
MRNGKIVVAIGTSVEMEGKVAYARMGKRTTVCLITLPNGYELIGSSCAVRDEDFDERYGKELALKDALEKADDVAAYMLRSEYVNEKKN